MMETRPDEQQKLFLKSAIAARDAARAERDAARAEAAELRKTLRAVLDILKSGRSTGRNAIKALFAAEDVVMSALDGDNSAQDAA
jgi:hypothetical protein